MHIALDISPLSTGHKFRGTGFYTLHLKNALEKYFPENRYTFFTNKTEIPKDVDIIHYPYFDPFSFSVPFGNPKKTVVTVLDLTPIRFPNAFPAGIKGSLRWQAQKIALKRIAGILTDSHSAKKDIVDIVKVPFTKVAIAYLAAGEEFVVLKDKEKVKKNLQKQYNLPDKFALYVGDVTWNKNLPRLIDAAMAAEIPLVMVGKSLVNNDFDKINAWNKDLITVQQKIENNKNILTLGFIPQEDLVGLYNSGTCFVMPSLYEGFGLPILEAMACGCPVITSKEGSLVEVAADAAYFIDAYNTENIAEGIKKVSEEPKLQQELSKKGLVNAKKFSWRKTAAETIQAYTSFLK